MILSQRVVPHWVYVSLVVKKKSSNWYSQYFMWNDVTRPAWIGLIRQTDSGHHAAFQCFDDRIVDRSRLQDGKLNLADCWREQLNLLTHQHVADDSMPFTGHVKTRSSNLEFSKIFFARIAIVVVEGIEPLSLVSDTPVSYHWAIPSPKKERFKLNCVPLDFTTKHAAIQKDLKEHTGYCRGFKVWDYQYYLSSLSKVHNEHLRWSRNWHVTIYF